MYIQEIHFSTNSWTGPDEETLLVPKDEGIEIIIYDLQSRVFGFGFAWDDLSDTDLKRLNYFRADKSYLEKDAAKLLQNWSALKKHLSR